MLRAHSHPGGILGGPVDGAARLAAEYPPVDAVQGLSVLQRASGFVGVVAECTKESVVLKGGTGLAKKFANVPGAFAVEGRPIRLVVPDIQVVDDASEGPDLRGGIVTRQRTASGSRAVVGANARVARAGRIYVEGVHDAELVEKVWGDDLRVEGVVVERLDGIDDLDHEVRTFGPGPGRRLGVLVDHLVPGSKEARLAAAIRDPHVLVTGTPYVDVWEAVRPRALGIDAWPKVPMGQPWKEGICAALGVGDPGVFWKRILASVNDWSDLEQPLVAAVEQLVDFVTEPG
jgi:hypothetical protein